MRGPSRGWLDASLQEPRYTEKAANRAAFAASARRAAVERKPLDWWLHRPPYAQDPDGFTLVYQRYYALMARLAAG